MKLNFNRTEQTRIDTTTIKKMYNNNKSLDTSLTTFNNNNSQFSNFQNHSTNSSDKSLSYEFQEEQETCLQLFDKWSPNEQLEFVENLLRRMCHFQHGHVNNFLKPMLQRDFISSLPGTYKYNFKLIRKYKIISRFFVHSTDKPLKLQEKEILSLWLSFITFYLIHF